MSGWSSLRWLGLGVVACALMSVAPGEVRAQQQAAVEQKVAAIKQAFATSMAELHGYEWIETVTVKVDGDQKSQKQNRCYYGADGKEERVPIDGGSANEGRRRRGIRGRVVERKTDEMEAYIQKAVGLIRQYVPTDPGRLQAVKDRGAQRLEILDNATRVRADFPEYLKHGDLLSVDVDPTGDRIQGVTVASYIDDNPQDAVNLEVTFATLQDGTSYPSKIALHGASKKLDIVVDNSGYRKSGS